MPPSFLIAGELTPQQKKIMWLEEKITTNCGDDYF
jgi:hypothetical protein